MIERILMDDPDRIKISDHLRNGLNNSHNIITIKKEEQ